MTPLQVYLILMLDNISDLVAVLTGIFFLLSLLSLVGNFVEKACPDEISGVLSKIPLKSTLATLALLITLCTFLPTTKQAAIIYALPAITQNKDVQEIPNKLLKLTNDWIKELSPTQTP